MWSSEFSFRAQVDIVANRTYQRDIVPRIEKIVPNLYRDSLSLMELSARLCGCPGITRAAAVMASKANLDLLAEAGLSSAAMQPRPHDILLVIEGGDESSINDAMKQAQSVLHGSGSLPVISRSGLEAKSSSIAMAVEERPSMASSLAALRHSPSRPP